MHYTCNLDCNLLIGAKSSLPGKFKSNIQANIIQGATNKFKIIIVQRFGTHFFKTNIQAKIL